MPQIFKTLLQHYNWPMYYWILKPFIIGWSCFPLASGTFLLNICWFREEAYCFHLTQNPPRWYMIWQLSAQISLFGNFHSLDSVLHVALQHSRLKVEASKLLTFPSIGTLLYPLTLRATKTPSFRAVRWSVTSFGFLRQPAYTWKINQRLILTKLLKQFGGRSYSWIQITEIWADCSWHKLSQGSSINTARYILN